MSSTVAEPKAAPAAAPKKEIKSNDDWRGFEAGLWQRDVNVRWFIQRNYTTLKFLHDEALSEVLA